MIKSSVHSPRVNAANLSIKSLFGTHPPREASLAGGRTTSNPDKCVACCVHQPPTPLPPMQIALQPCKRRAEIVEPLTQALLEKIVFKLTSTRLANASCAAIVTTENITHNWAAGATNSSWLPTWSPAGVLGISKLSVSDSPSWFWCGPQLVVTGRHQSLPTMVRSGWLGATNHLSTTVVNALGSLGCTTASDSPV